MFLPRRLQRRRPVGEFIHQRGDDFLSGDRVAGGVGARVAVGAGLVERLPRRGGGGEAGQRQLGHGHDVPLVRLGRRGGLVLGHGHARGGGEVEGGGVAGRRWGGGGVRV